MLGYARLCKRSVVVPSSSRLLAPRLAWMIPECCCCCIWQDSTKMMTRRERHEGIHQSRGRVKGFASSGPTLKGGSIHVIIGPMFSGKTSRLLRETEELERQGVTDIMLLKSEKDSRYSSDHIVSHDGILRKCFAVRELCRDVMEPGPLKELYDSSRVVAIDEAQFFDRDLIEFCMRAADDDDKHVILAGLDGDFMRSRFGYVLDMIPLADTVTKLTGTCHFCEEKALFSKRIHSDSDRQEEIGGAERYVPVCRRHYR